MENMRSNTVYVHLCVAGNLHLLLGDGLTSAVEKMRQCRDDFDDGEDEANEAANNLWLMSLSKKQKWCQVSVTSRPMRALLRRASHVKRGSRDMLLISHRSERPHERRKSWKGRDARTGSGSNPFNNRLEFIGRKGG